MDNHFGKVMLKAWRKVAARLGARSTNHLVSEHPKLILSPLDIPLT